jgi:hypothetical protein
MLKTLSTVILGAALAAFVAQAQVRFVQLEIRNATPQQRFKSATNEIVTVRSVTYFARFLTGPTVTANKAGQSDPLFFSVGAEYMGELDWTFTGSAASGDPNGLAVCILRVETVNTAGTDPAQVAVVPRGEPARVELQTSADLREWSALAVTNLPATEANRFLRVRVSAPAE